MAKKPFRSVLNDDLGLENKEAEESGEGDHSAVLDFVKGNSGRSDQRRGCPRSWSTTLCA